MSTSHIALGVTVGDTAAVTSVLVDGRDVIAAEMTNGWGEPPEQLFPALRAETAPHEVRVAEAYCGECCGALYVTVERRGDEVVWRDWRNPSDPRPARPADTFDAAQYDAELARADADRSWEWYERTVARLMHERLTQDQTPLMWWNCELDGVVAYPNKRGSVTVSYTYPRPPREHFMQFVTELPVHGGAPDVVADALVDRLCRSSPVRQDRVVGGSRAAAEAFGFGWP
ncbi:hypothetical protein ACIA8K_28880 [Catenuloplanes sp. NPDC051500]|uniref:hypothetical protein n=1 Tax=Catenuloplanes sp. NPDC051500 TaxID=3363959 RepID=UPI00379D3425